MNCLISRTTRLNKRVASPFIKEGKIGRVKLQGQTWAAKLTNPGAEIIEGAKLKIVEVEGNTVIVEPVD